MWFDFYVYYIVHNGVHASNSIAHNVDGMAWPGMVCGLGQAGRPTTKVRMRK